jgi:predicted AlkP superfamily phosphohydrolase/phosphomutase
VVKERTLCALPHGNPFSCPSFFLDGFRTSLYNGKVVSIVSTPKTDLRKWAALLTVLVVAGCVGGCRRAPATHPVTTQVVVLGFDGADPNLLSRWAKQGKLPNLARLAQTGTFRPLGTTNPPESPVAWASFATGLNPGGTGIFDFLRRDPQTYLPELALVSREKAKFLFGLIPIKPPRVINERSGVPFYKAVADAGYKTTAIRMPLEFPPTRLPSGKLWAGLGVPDLRGTWGTFFYFGTELTQWDVGDTEFGGKLVRLEMNGNEASAVVEGPVDPTADSYRRISIPIQFKVAPEGNAVTIQLAGRTEAVAERHWSDWYRVKFRITPFLSVRAICRFYVLQVSPDLRLYMSPLNLDPESPPLPIAYPANYTAELVKKHGLIKTLGWWHDTWALNEEKIDEGLFLEDAFRTMEAQAEITLDELKNDPPSLLVSVFLATDHVSHMFFRLLDPEHPRYDAELAAKYGDAILQSYERMDRIVGDVERAMKPGGTLIIVSDHGFHTWRKGFNTNTWLVQNGYMTLKQPGVEDKTYNLDNLFGQGSFFPNVDWSRTKAYALGLGQIYLNLRGREKLGILDRGPEADRLMEEIRQKLEAFEDPDTHQLVVHKVYLGREIFHGPRMSEAPDIQVDFRDGYRTSWQTSLGAIPSGIVVANMKKWSGDHCASDPSDTQGIFLSNRPITTATPSILDVAPTVISILGVQPPGKLDGQPLEFDSSP